MIQVSDEAVEAMAAMRWNEGRNPDPDADSPTWDELYGEGMKSQYRADARASLEEAAQFLGTDA